LPLFGLMKYGVTKVLEQEANKMMFEYAWKNLKYFLKKCPLWHFQIVLI
jgi:hypothetical protein